MLRLVVFSSRPIDSIVNNGLHGRHTINRPFFRFIQKEKHAVIPAAMISAFQEIYIGCSRIEFPFNDRFVLKIATAPNCYTHTVCGAQKKAACACV